MKTLLNLLILGVFMGATLTACKKEADIPATPTIENSITQVTGTLSTFRDTASVTEGDVTITYSKTLACYPSNEVFAFTAVAKNTPATTKYV